MGTRGWEHWDACVGTWDLGLGDIEYAKWNAGASETGTQVVKYRDAGMSNTRTPEHQIQGRGNMNDYCKSQT